MERKQAFNKLNPEKKIVLITTSTFNIKNTYLLHASIKNKIYFVLNPLGRTLKEPEIKDLIVKYNPIGLIAGLEPLTESVLSLANELKVISRCGAGIDNIDLKAAHQNGIRVFNTPNVVVRAVAELTTGLIFNIVRRIGEGDRGIRNRNWTKVMGRQIAGMNIGIVGCGKIGSMLASLLKPFDCKIIGYDKNINQHKNIKMVSKNKLISKSDLITLHLPLAKDTFHMVNDSFINMMKDRSFIINTSRGEIIYEASLIRGLKSGKIAGVAIDTFEREPYLGALCKFENVLLTPHIGSYTEEARIAMEQEAAENLMKGVRRYL